MLFITYNDAPTGIYFSQVTDVCNFLNERLIAKIKLIALVSLRKYWSDRKKIKAQFHDSTVVPMFPGVGNWKINYYLLYLLLLFINSKKVIARGPFATSLAIQLKKSSLVKYVYFDARGAYDAEFNEYDVAGSNELKENISEIEKNALLNSDFRIAVSDRLVEYWKRKMNYSGNGHIIIPCTYHSQFFGKVPDEIEQAEKRKLLGFSNEDVIFVYSGSSAEWQSLMLADDFLCKIFSTEKNAKLLLLAKSIPHNLNIIKNFKERVIMKWVNAGDVSSILSCCDYGIVIREKSVTNSVASPVKFAEYLISGLKIIISENVGDYSEFVRHHDCGNVISDLNKDFTFQKILFEEKMQLHQLALNHFSKDSQIANYKKIVN